MYSTMNPSPTTTIPRSLVPSFTEFSPRGEDCRAQANVNQTSPAQLPLSATDVCHCVTQWQKSNAILHGVKPICIKDPSLRAALS